MKEKCSILKGIDLHPKILKLSFDLCADDVQFGMAYVFQYVRPQRACP